MLEAGNYERSESLTMALHLASDEAAGAASSTAVAGGACLASGPTSAGRVDAGPSAETSRHCHMAAGCSTSRLGAADAGSFGVEPLSLGGFATSPLQLEEEALALQPRLLLAPTLVPSAEEVLASALRPEQRGSSRLGDAPPQL